MEEDGIAARAALILRSLKQRALRRGEAESYGRTWKVGVFEQNLSCLGDVE